MRRGPDLIVPIRDRRQHRRILTLKNFGKVLAGVIIVFAGLTLQSDFRHRKSGDDYGRLFGKQVSSHVTIEPKKPDIVTEPIEDQTAADPLLVAAAAREQYLRVEPTTTATVETTTTAGVPQTDSGSVAGPNGIVIVRGKIDQQHPTLSGGVFRQ